MSINPNNYPGIPGRGKSMSAKKAAELLGIETVELPLKGEQLLPFNGGDFALIIRSNGDVEVYKNNIPFKTIWDALKRYGLYEKEDMIRVADNDRDPVCPDCGCSSCFNAYHSNHKEVE